MKSFKFLWRLVRKALGGQKIQCTYFNVVLHAHILCEISQKARMLIMS